MTVALAILAALGIGSLLALAWVWRRIADAPAGNLGEDE